MNIDGNFILGLVVLPFFIVEMALGSVEYATVDYLLANANIICIIIASTALTAAMDVGQAGPVQAIEMMKTVWQVVLTVVIDKSIPVPIEIAGCITGILGVVIIVLHKNTH
eukprot:CAMPEP_0116950588 /NCGR_PEP_ID=MMETSP0467-20121206/39559_1 /TAXON_ID=283647 /ORGANISM="Mesodinium pulex, Strain SPMC105" /LENGTH=110 /DNA_ID=CAMNT_0004635363 /DNA_START=829 /DNA_END=1161 /DNA_ORIENTATION=-